MARRTYLGLIVACGLGAAAPAGATIYRCVDAHGQVAFQDRPCPAHSRASIVRLPEDDVASPSAAAMTTSPSPTATSAPPPLAPAAPPPPRPPVPGMYVCTNAVNGDHYYSDDGITRPYLAPLGMTGAITGPLGEAYSPSTGTHGSTPESMHGQVTPGLVAGNYVWVQDGCRRMSDGETCTVLQKRYDDNERALRNAFQSDRPPLEQREAQLRDELAGCR
jgi:hypothetical protein